MEFKKSPESNVWVPVPLNWMKNTFELSHCEAKGQGNLPEALQSLCIEYAFHPRFKELHGLLARQAPSKFKSEQWFKAIITGWEQACSESSLPRSFAELVEGSD